MVGYWEVVALVGGGFACQRTPPMGDDELETVESFGTEEAAQRACDQLNEDVPAELAALPDHLRPAGY